MTTPEKELLPKISVKTVGADGAIAKVTKTKTPLMRIIGVARNIKSATGQNGDPVFGLTGQFEATNIRDGKVYNSAVCYLPNGILELVMDPLEAVLNGEDRVAKSQGIQFAMDIFAVPDSNKSGYTFTAAMISEALQADPLEALKATIGQAALPKMPKLDAPSAAS